MHYLLLFDDKTVNVCFITSVLFSFLFFQIMAVLEGHFVFCSVSLAEVHVISLPTEDDKL